MAESRVGKNRETLSRVEGCGRHYECSVREVGVEADSVADVVVDSTTLVGVVIIYERY